MDFKDSTPEAAFRAKCRAWLEANAERKQRVDELYGRGLGQAEMVEASRAWQACKAHAGFGAITWDKALGGLGGTPMQEMIYREEEGQFLVPRNAFAVSLGMVIPALAAHGSDAQRARFVEPALYGRELWCQLLSEPDAGSDLGMVRTRAERCTDGRDGWLLKGQKVWTTYAQFADFGMVLARTDPDKPKFDGLTCFYVDMRAAGVEVRPIRQASGEAEFNEVFLNEVFVPDTQRIGEVCAGWKVTMTALMSERLSIGGVIPPGLWQRGLALMREAPGFDGAPAIEDGRMRERLAELYMNTQGLWLMQARALTALGRGEAPGPELSVAKIVGARTLQDFAYLAFDLKGQQSMLTSELLGDSWSNVEDLWFGAAGMRIAGGTDEIVKNSVGERVLGLPGEPRTDKGIPFRELS